MRIGATRSPDYSARMTRSIGGDGLAGLTLRNRTPVSGRARAAELPPGLQKYLQTAEASLAEPFKGVTTDGRIVPGLFQVAPTGVSTQPIADAALAWLASLGAEQQARARFDVHGDAWRRWSNIHPFLLRHGVSLDEMSRTQRDLALALPRATLSAEGFDTARDVMRLNDLVCVL